MIIWISGSRRLHGSDRAGAEPPRRGGGRAHQDRLCGLVVRILMMMMVVFYCDDFGVETSDYCLLSGMSDCQCIRSQRAGLHQPIWRNCRFGTRPWIGASQTQDWCHSDTTTWGGASENNLELTDIQSKITGRIDLPLLVFSYNVLKEEQSQLDSSDRIKYIE